MSGGTSERPEFRQLFIDAHQKKFDIVLFWALDRFSREGARETINHLAILESYGVGFISFTEPYLNSIGILKDAIIGILATLAKQEKVRIQERVRAGLETARRKGKKLGRRALPPIDRRRIIEAHLANPDLSTRKLAEQVKCNYGTVNKTLSFYRSGKCDKDGFLCEKSAVNKTDDLLIQDETVLPNTNAEHN